MLESKTPDPYGLDATKKPATKKPAASGTAPAAASGAAPAGATDSRFTLDRIGGVYVLTLTETTLVDQFAIEKLGDGIYHALKTLETPRVVLDLGRVEHLSSAALGMLIALRKVMTEKLDGTICIANVNDQIMEIFKLTKLHKLMKMHGSTDKAIKSLL